MLPQKHAYSTRVDPTTISPCKLLFAISSPSLHKGWQQNSIRREERTDNEDSQGQQTTWVLVDVVGKFPKCSDVTYSVNQIGNLGYLAMAHSSQIHGLPVLLFCLS